MKNIRLLSLVCMAFVCSTIVSRAQVPELVNYQGRVADSGQLVSGAKGIVFRIYDDPTAGTLLYTESQTVNVVDGLFSTSIGLTNATPGALFTALSGATVYLELEYESEILSPRQRMVSVPFAMTAGGVPAGAISSGMIAPDAIDNSHITDGTITGADLDQADVASLLSTDFWSPSGNAGTVDGTSFLGTTDNIPLELRVNNERVYRIEVPASFSGGNIIGGYFGNSVTAGMVGATISGGGRFGTPNTVTGAYGTVSGGRGGVAAQAAVVCGGNRGQATGVEAFVGSGFQCMATELRAAVICGQDNIAHARESFVGGGLFNDAYGQRSVISGGSFNETGSSGESLGLDATVPGGSANRAVGNYSFAAGRRARALHEGAFVWADNQVGLAFESTAVNEFSVRAAGGTRFVSAIDAMGVPTAGVILSSGAGAWSALSDRASKENIIPVNPHEVLEKVAELPIARWNWKAQDASIQHIGPMAQDFHAAFQLGDSDKRISTVDTDGVALAAIQALKAENDALKTQNVAILERLEALEEKLQRVEATAASE